MRLEATFDAIAEWTYRAALPFWAREGVDRHHGGFVEELDFQGQDAARPYKRTRVACRQIYVFSHAALLGWRDGADLIAHGAEYLTQKAWRSADQGLARRLTREGETLDPTPDLYDHAFALFAFAYAARATGEAAYREWIERIADFIEDKLRHPSGEGFLDESPAPARRRQNPHMHLLEATLAAYETTEDPRFERLARDLVDLFKTRFFDRASQTLGEVFTETWARAPGAQGDIVEPGHQLEWAWILRQCARLFSIDCNDDSRLLIDLVERRGLNPETGAVINQMQRDGAALDNGSRCWPNTERLKAAVALHEIGGGDARAMVESSAQLLLKRYLSPTTNINIPRGGWIDAFDGAGRPIATAMPASTLYHLFVAFSEVLRIRESFQQSPRL